MGELQWCISVRAVLLGNVFFITGRDLVPDRSGVAPEPESWV